MSDPPSVDRQREITLVVYELALRAMHRDGIPIPPDLPWCLGRLSLNAPQLAARLPMVRATLSPEVLGGAAMNASLQQGHSIVAPGAAITSSPRAGSWSPSASSRPPSHCSRASQDPRPRETNEPASLRLGAPAGRSAQTVPALR